MEFEVSGNAYRSSKLGAKQQFHLARRLAPVISGLKGQTDDSRLFETIADSIAGMSDENCDYILDTCLGVVQRQQGNAWARVFNERSHTLQFEDIDMGGMLTIARYVLEENLGGFFGGKLATAESSQAPTA